MSSHRPRPTRQSGAPLRPYTPRRLAACLSLALIAPSAFAVNVQNCNDGGSGSLRDAVVNAVNGSSIDFDGLTCNTITLTSGALPVGGVGNLTINGPGSAALTVTASDASRVIEQQGSGLLTISGLTLAHGHGDAGGGCILAAGSLTLTDVTATACTAGTAQLANIGGGAISATGNVTVSASTFTGNTVEGSAVVQGGAIAAGANLSVDGSTFSGNLAWSHGGAGGSGDNAEGGALFSLGTLTLVGSTVSGNTVRSDNDAAFGGGVSAGSKAGNLYSYLDVANSVIDGNTATSDCGVCAPQGGGLVVVGDSRFRHATVSNNTVTSAGHYGGAGGFRAFRAYSVDMASSLITGNHADTAGGGMIAPEYGVVTMVSTTVSNNAVRYDLTGEGGGGVLCLACAMEVDDSTISGNTSPASGGGISIAYGNYNATTTNITNTTISGNTGYVGGGILVDGGDPVISNSTIAFNTASTRGAGISGSEYSYNITLQSTIVSNNLTGTSANNVWAFPDSVSGSHNLIPHAGGPATMPDDTIVLDPLLQPLADNGGPTLTHALGDGSPAIDAGNNLLNRQYDQRGPYFVRAAGSAPDIGAFEQQPQPDRLFADGFEGGSNL